MVVEDMRNTGVMGTPEEYFIPWDPSKEGINWSDAFGKVRERATGSNGVMAIKVMANQLHKIDACLASFQPDAPEGGVYPRVAAAFAGATWLKITRRDIVLQAISRVMSRQTGINHATAKPEDTHFAGNLKAGLTQDYNQNTVYRFGAILREVTAITLENMAWDRFYETNGITPTEMIYEDFAADEAMNHLDTIAFEAGIADPFERTARKMVKMANARNLEWRDRFFSDADERNFRPQKR